MKSYIDYEYYKDCYYGIEIPEMDFNRIAAKASVFIREITFDRIDEESISDTIKDAVCSVCEVLRRDEALREQYGGREVKSENNDGFSVTFTTEELDGQTHEETLRKKMYLAAHPHLMHTDLLYLGW